MADILINDETLIKGKFSLSRALDTRDKYSILIIKGRLVTCSYLEEIKTIETKRYLLKNVEIIEEDFGSDDEEIIYIFSAGSLEIKGGNTLLSKEGLKELETKLYGGNINGQKKI